MHITIPTTDNILTIIPVATAKLLISISTPKNIFDFELCSTTETCKMARLLVMKNMRLSKIIAGSGLCSRREAEKWIIAGRVQVNGEKDTSVAKVITKEDEILLDGLKLKPMICHTRPKLFAVHKLAGELVSERDPQKNRATIYDRLKSLISAEGNLKPVTRLEYNTEGLLLLTNNAELARFLNDPSNNFERRYRLRIYGKVTDSKIEGFKRGLVIDGIKYAPMQVRVQNQERSNSWVGLSCIENRVSLILA